jgi:choline kinase
MRDTTSVVILAAGLGTRLQRPHPKPLTPLTDGRSILRRQLDQFATAYGDALRPYVVVGFKLELVMEAAPEALFVYNEVYDQTNTSKSLLKALRLTPPGSGVLWINGDVVFDPIVLDRLEEVVAGAVTTVCVNTASVAEEEVKYTLDDDGYVRELSKTVVGGLGEAVGINFVAGQDKALLIKHLEACDDNDYFERALEQAITQDGLRVTTLDISDLDCVEVDFEADLVRARLL